MMELQEVLFALNPDISFVDICLFNEVSNMTFVRLSTDQAFTSKFADKLRTWEVDEIDVMGTRTIVGPNGRLTEIPTKGIELTLHKPQDMSDKEYESICRLGRSLNKGESNK